MGGLVRIDADNDHGYGFPSLDGWGIRGGQSDFKYLSQQLAVTPLFSHAANADRRGDTPQLSQPKARVTGFN